jgi:hypothetical protein
LRAISPQISETLGVTLNLIIINRSGIWQSADFRGTDPKSGSIVDDYLPKHVALRCTDGSATLAYTGLAAALVQNERVRISDWIRQILRGESRTVDQSLIYLRERATADLGLICMKHGIAHVFTIGAFLGGHPWIAQIRNFRFAPGVLGPPVRDFITVAERIDDAGRSIALGTPDVVRPADLRTLDRVANIKPRQPKELRKLLAAINHRAAATRPYGHYVSPHCTTVYLPPAGEPFEHEIHAATGASKPIATPFLLFGIDMTDVQEFMLQRSKAAREGRSLPDVATLIHDRLARESVIPCNPFRPTLSITGKRTDKSGP